jgi:protein-S-isoprenylcysteine O-methyltransferase Ste14
MNPENRCARSAVLAYGLVAYASFHASFLALILFANDLLAPFPLSGGEAQPLGHALAVDCSLIGLFAVQHTVMARRGFKRAWTRIVPRPIERSTFVLTTAACIAAILAGWVPISGTVWRVEAPALRAALWLLQGAGWLVLVASTFAIGHWELFGVRQVLAYARRAPSPPKAFRTPLLYRFVRHPMMLGFLIGFWSTPEMSAGHLALALGFSAYLLVGIRIEERDLVATLGDDYRRYQQRVPRLIPGLSRRRRAAEGGLERAVEVR